MCIRRFVCLLVVTLVVLCVCVPPSKICVLRDGGVHVDAATEHTDDLGQDVSREDAAVERADLLLLGAWASSSEHRGLPLRVHEPAVIVSFSPSSLTMCTVVATGLLEEDAEDASAFKSLSSRKRSVRLLNLAWARRRHQSHHRRKSVQTA